MSAGYPDDQVIPEIVQTVGQVMSTATRNLRAYPDATVRELLAWSRANDVPELAGRCEQELQIRRGPGPEVRRSCRNCGRRIRRVRPEDGPELSANWEWLHAETRVVECGVVLRAAPVVDGPSAT